MAKYKIAWLPGDGIGTEVMEAARMVLDHLGRAPPKKRKGSLCGEALWLRHRPGVGARPGEG